MTLRDIRRHRDRSAPDLAGKAVRLPGRIMRGLLVAKFRKFHRQLPNFQISIGLDGRSHFFALPQHPAPRTQHPSKLDNNTRPVSEHRIE